MTIRLADRRRRRSHGRWSEGARRSPGRSMSAGHRLNSIRKRVSAPRQPAAKGSWSVGEGLDVVVSQRSLSGIARFAKTRARDRIDLSQHASLAARNYRLTILRTAQLAHCRSAKSCAVRRIESIQPAPVATRARDSPASPGPTRDGRSASSSGDRRRSDRFNATNSVGLGRPAMCELCCPMVKRSLRAASQAASG